MRVVIIGNGVAGVTAARFVRKWSDAAITIISDESDHFFARTALMYIYMGHLRYRDTKPYEDGFWAKNRIGLVRDRVVGIDPAARRLRLRDGAPQDYDVLVVATGSRPAFYDWPGQALDGVGGLVSLGDLARMERWTEGVERAVVVGGGLIGVEMAEMLHARDIGVTFLVREGRYFGRTFPPEEAALVEREIRRHGVDLRTGTELERIEGRDGRAVAVHTTAGERIPAGFVGLATGVRPNLSALEGSGIETARGVLVDDHFRTSAPGVYAVGDCAEFRDAAVGHRPVEQLWYTARRHGETVAATICGRPTPYDRGVFFNSAKFFTVEYQTYGDVPIEPSDGEASFVWTDAPGRRLVRLVWEREGGRVRGVLLLGVRHRHAVWRRWIEEGRRIDDVLARLPEADFDPEFADRHVPDLVARCRAEHGLAAPAAPARRGLVARLFS